MRLTNQQQLHREYLRSPVWQAKRLEALAFYGAICNRCKEHGTDVHHKTYDLVGGNELMEDLEILCRGCHEAHHRVDKVVSRNRTNSRRGIHRKAILSLLDQWMKTRLKREQKLSTDGELYLRIMKSKGDSVALVAAKMLGCDYVFGRLGRKRNPQRPIRQCNIKGYSTMKWIPIDSFNQLQQHLAR